MKKILLLSVMICFISCDKDEKFTKIKILNPKIALGEIPFKKSKDFYIALVNEGKEDLNIENVQPSCKCTTYKGRNSFVVPPGTKDSIKMTMTSNEVGKFEETVVIVANTVPKFTIVKISSNTEADEVAVK